MIALGQADGAAARRPAARRRAGRSRRRARRAGATRLASPIRSASVPSTNFEHMMSSFARPRPTIAGSREQPPRSGSRPTRVSTRPMTASLGDDAQVAGQRELGGAAEAGAVDLRDRRLGHALAEVPDRQDLLAPLAQRLRVAADRRRGRRCPSRSRTSCPAPRTTTQRTATSRGGRAQRLAEPDDELGVERVALLRAVEDDVADRAAVLLQDDAHVAEDRCAARLRPRPSVLERRPAVGEQVACRRRSARGRPSGTGPRRRARPTSCR